MQFERRDSRIGLNSVTALRGQQASQARSYRIISKIALREIRGCVINLASFRVGGLEWLQPTFVKMDGDQEDERVHFQPLDTISFDLRCLVANTTKWR